MAGEGIEIRGWEMLSAASLVGNIATSLPTDHIMWLAATTKNKSSLSGRSLLIGRAEPKDCTLSRVLDPFAVVKRTPH